jgi:hypothetical protein
MCKDPNRIKVGQHVTFPDGFNPSKVYKVLCHMENGTALCEDNLCNRYTFSKSRLIHATDEQINEFYNIK